MTRLHRSRWSGADWSRCQFFRVVHFDHLVQWRQVDVGIVRHRIRIFDIKTIFLNETKSAQITIDASLLHSYSWWTVGFCLHPCQKGGRSITSAAVIEIDAILVEAVTIIRCSRMDLEANRMMSTRYHLVHFTSWYWRIFERRTTHLIRKRLSTRDFLTFNAWLTRQWQ